MNVDSAVATRKRAARLFARLLSCEAKKEREAGVVSAHLSEGMRWWRVCVGVLTLKEGKKREWKGLPFSAVVRLFLSGVDLCGRICMHLYYICV